MAPYGTTSVWTIEPVMSMKTRDRAVSSRISTPTMGPERIAMPSIKTVKPKVRHQRRRVAAARSPANTARPASWPRSCQRHAPTQREERAYGKHAGQHEVTLAVPDAIGLDWDSRLPHNGDDEIMRLP